MGPYSSTAKVKVFVNSKLINDIKFTVNKYGYLTPNVLTSKQLEQLDLKYGKNIIEYRLEEVVLTGEIYLYTDLDKLIVSDVDGTLTKNDLGGLYNNYMGNNYLHDGYH